MSFVDIDTSLDFPDDNDSSKNISELLKRLEDLSKGVDPSKDPSLVDADESRVAEELAERCLSYLGDLCLGHYKLGVMDIGRAFRINIVFHFLRSLLLSQPYALSKDKLLNELSQNENRLKDLRLAALRFLQVIFLNTRYHLGLKKNPSQANLNDPLFTAVVSDMAFILRSESKRFGSQYIKEMLPTLTRPYNGVPDFCPDPTRTLGLAGTSTSLLPAIIMRIIAITILSNELLLGSDQDDKIREEQVKAIFEKSRQLPSLLLNTLDLLLIYSFRSLAKSTNIFTTSVVDMMRELYGEDDDGTCCGGVLEEALETEGNLDENKEDEEISQKEGEAEARFFSKTIKKSTDNTESVGIESEEIEQEEESSDDGESEGSDFGRLRGHRLRRLRARCRMIDEDDVINSSSSEYSYVEEEDDDPYGDSEDDDDEHSEFNLPEEEDAGNEDGGGDQYPAYDDFDVEIDDVIDNEEDAEDENKLRTSEDTNKKLADELAKVRIPHSTPERSRNVGAAQNGEVGSNSGSDNDGNEEEYEESDESDREYETSSDYDEEDAGANYGPIGQPRVWLRLFVASFFVDIFIAGIKLILEWLLTAQPFLKVASTAHPLLMQQVVSHFASLINFLNPIVALAKKESESEEIMKGRCRGLPIHYIHSTTPELLPHVSSQCREMLKREFESDKTPQSQPPLSEEWLIRSTPTMSIAFNAVNFDVKPLKNRIEETLVRCVKLTKFGHEFCKLAEELGLNLEYHNDVDYFLAPLPSGKDSSEGISSHGSGKHSYRKNRKRSAQIKVDLATRPKASMDEETMRNLAKRRLENEVASLSNLKPSRNRLPHIVIDSYCLISNSIFMSRLLKSKSTVIVVPSKVVKHLDQLKKTSAAARSATRMLEEGQTTCIHIQEAAETPEGSIQLRLGGTNLNADESVDGRVTSTDSDPVNFGVLYRWVNIIECSIYFASRKKKVSFFKGAEIEVGKSVELVNVLEFQSTLPEIEKPTISVVINTKASPAEELRIPAEFVKIAHDSGVVFEALHKFSRRWKFTDHSHG
nr:protein SMG5 [Hymenolepis microstoma]